MWCLPVSAHAERRNARCCRRSLLPCMHHVLRPGPYSKLGEAALGQHVAAQQDGLRALHSKRHLLHAVHVPARVDV